MTTEQDTINDANAFLMGQGGRSAKFTDIGDKVSGTVTDATVREQTDFASGEVLHWPDGNVKQQLVVTLLLNEPEDEDDDGFRRVFFKGQMAAALKDAVRQTGETGIGIGARLAVRYDGDGIAAKGMNPPKQYSVRYEAPPARQVEVPGDEDMPF